MSKEQFNPQDYKSYEELPKDKKKDFAPVEGGFIYQEAAENDKRFEKTVTYFNKKRSILDKALGENKESFVDIAHENALIFNENKHNENGENLEKEKQKGAEDVDSIVDEAAIEWPMGILGDWARVGAELGKKGDKLFARKFALASVGSRKSDQNGNWMEIDRVSWVKYSEKIRDINKSRWGSMPNLADFINE